LVIGANSIWTAAGPFARFDTFAERWAVVADADEKRADSGHALVRV
jgi:hypothetical protein